MVYCLYVFFGLIRLLINILILCFIFLIDLSGSEDDEAAAVLEEKEALALQKKMAAELDDQDFDLDIFKVYIVNRKYYMHMSINV